MNTKLVNIIGFLASIILLISLSVSMVKALLRLKNGDNLIEKNKAKLEKIEADNQKLEDQLKLIQSDVYFEEQVRNKLGLVKDGETVVVLPDPEVVKRLSPQIPEEISVKPKPIWQKWLKLFTM